MGQAGQVAALDEAVGYVLKQTVTTLRAAMDRVLSPLELTVPQYACLELLKQNPGLSNSELARRAFVSRQSMNGLLSGLQDRGLVARPAIAPHGRELPAELTPVGREQHRAASGAVRHIERKMVAYLTPTQQQQLREHLRTCIRALTDRDT